MSCLSIRAREEPPSLADEVSHVIDMNGYYFYDDDYYFYYYYCYSYYHYYYYRFCTYSVMAIRVE